MRSLMESHFLEFLSAVLHPGFIKKLVANGSKHVIPVSAEENLLGSREGLPPPFCATGPLVGCYLSNIVLHSFTQMCETRYFGEVIDDSFASPIPGGQAREVQLGIDLPLS